MTSVRTSSASCLARRCAAFASSCFSILRNPDANRRASAVPRDPPPAPPPSRRACLCSCAATTARPVMSDTDSINPRPARLGTVPSMAASRVGALVVSARNDAVTSAIVRSGRNFTRSVTANLDAGTGTTSAGGRILPHRRTRIQSGSGAPNRECSSGSTRRNGSFPPSSSSPTRYSLSDARVAATYNGFGHTARGASRA